MARPSLAFDYNFRKSWVWRCDKCGHQLLCDNKDGPPDWEIEEDKTICAECGE